MIDTPFTTGKAYRDDELGEAAVQRANWRYAFFGALGLAALLTLLLFYTVSLPRKVPVPIVVYNDSGDVRVVQEAWHTFVPPSTAYVAQLRKDIVILRTITLDKEAMRQQHVEARTRMTLQGKKQYNQYEKDRKPFDQKEPVTVDILSSLPDSGLTWDVRWRETTYSHKVEIEHWRGRFTFVKAVPQNDAERYATPLGLFLDSWAWSKE
jgi:type IV secretory pathway TrbF-like protein